MVNECDLVFLKLVLLAQDYRIPVIPISFSGMGFGEPGNSETKAILLTYRGAHMIVIDSGLAPEERNLSLAHELGHVRLHGKKDGFSITTLPENEWRVVERQADRFGEKLIGILQNI
jgi:Zn-dependent peptidase ImmA (M78 family)